jgi:DNA-directed RNA polymerase specialized sigma24 family protein
MLKKAIENIISGNCDLGREIFTEQLANEFIRVIMSKTAINNKNEALSIFYEAYIILSEQIKSNTFIFQDESKLKRYFITICLNKAREYVRTIKQQYLISSEDIEEYHEQFVDKYEEIREQEYLGRISEGFELDFNASNSTKFPISVLNAFHGLNEKCKFIIILKHKLSLKHSEIVDILYPFYKVKNKEVSKSELQKCMKMLRKKIRSVAHSK